MKNKSRKYVLLSAAIISSLLFTACGKQSEPVKEAPEAAIAEETGAEETTAEDTAAEETSQNNTAPSNLNAAEDTALPGEGNNGEGAVDALGATEEFTETDSGLSLSNITVNADGSYSFTDDFMIAVQGINGAAGLSDKRLEEVLQVAASVIVNEQLTDEQDIAATIATEISIQEYEQATEKPDTSAQQTQAPQTQPESPKPQPNHTEQVGPSDHLFEFEDFSGGTHDENASTGGVGTHH